MTDPMHAFMNQKMPTDSWYRRIMWMVVVAFCTFAALVFGLEAVLKLV